MPLTETKGKEQRSVGRIQIDVEKDGMKAVLTEKRTFSDGESAGTAFSWKEGGRPLTAL